MFQLHAARSAVGYRNIGFYLFNGAGRRAGKLCALAGDTPKGCNINIMFLTGMCIALQEARLHLKLFTLPSNIDSLRVHQILMVN